jgi:hypothetical protein
MLGVSACHAAIPPTKSNIRERILVETYEYIGTKTQKTKANPSSVGGPKIQHSKEKKQAPIHLAGHATSRPRHPHMSDWEKTQNACKCFYSWKIQIRQRK